MKSNGPDKEIVQERQRVDHHMRPIDELRCPQWYNAVVIERSVAYSVAHSEAHSEAHCVAHRLYHRLCDL